MNFFLSIHCVVLFFVWDVCEELAFCLTNEESRSVSVFARLETNISYEESGSVSATARLETNFTNEQPRAGFTNAESKMKFQSRIIGGEKADILEFPYMVSVQRWQNHICGGSLLSITLVLTAAHCCFDMNILINNRHPLFHIGEMSVLVGTKFSFYFEEMPDERGVKRGVIAMFPHKHFRLATFANDIAVMKLSYPVSLSTKIKLTPLPWKEKKPEDGTVCTAVGWGYSTPQPPFQEKKGTVEPLLRKVDLSVLDRANCQSVYKGYAIGQAICTYTVGKDTCAGDSGGPLLCNGVQAGLTSFSTGCAAEWYPGVSQRVDIHLGWLKTMTARALNASTRYVSTSFSLYIYILNVLFCYVYVTNK